MEDHISFSNHSATFGDRVVAGREALGLSQKQLARHLGVNAETLADWEEDRDEPRANRLQMLAGVLNVSLVWLMSGEGEGFPAATSGEDGASLEDLMSDMRALRAEHYRLAEQAARIEKRLRARLIA